MKTYAQFCGLARALDHVGDRWTLLIVRELLIRPRRFGDLVASLPGIATNLLTERLRALENDGLIERAAIDASTNASLYRLTPTGMDLERAILELVRFGRHFMDAPRSDDAFEPEWLALALRALLAPRSERDGTISIVAGGAQFVIELRDGSVDIYLGAAERADCSVRGEPQALLGVAAGAQTLASARRSRRLRVSGDVALLSELLQGPDR